MVHFGIGLVAVRAWLEWEVVIEVETLDGRLKAFRLLFRASRQTIVIDWEKATKWWSRGQIPVSAGEPDSWRRRVACSTRVGAWTSFLRRVKARPLNGNRQKNS